MKRRQSKPVWRSMRIQTAPPTRCHDGNRYCREAQPDVDDFQKEYEESQDEKDGVTGHLYYFLKYTVCPLVLVIFLGIVIAKPYVMVVEAVWTTMDRGWNILWHFNETARVVRQPEDQQLKAILEEAGFTDVLIVEEGLLKFRSEERNSRISLMNEKRRIKLLIGFDDVKISSEAINKWNKEYLYTRVFLDTDGYPVIQADMLLGENGVSHQALIGFCKVYGSIVDDFVDEQIGEVLNRMLESASPSEESSPSMRTL